MSKIVEIGVDVERKSHKFDQLYEFAVELFIMIPVVKLFKFRSVAVFQYA